MKVLIVGRYKKQYKNLMPFVTEQGNSIAALGNEVDYFAIKGKGMLAYFNSVKKLKKKIKEFNPDIIHAHYGLSGITAVMQSKVPVVITFHNGETLSWFTNFISSLFSLRAEHVIYVAQHIYKKCIFKRKKDYSIIPCGINIDDCQITDFEKARKKLNLSSDKKYILFGGAFANTRKNYALLKEALLNTRRTVCKCTEGDDYGDIVCLEMKGLSRQSCVLRMCACDLFVLPSKSEGSPQALKEAMACNCPIVATDIADIKHLLGDVDGHYICSFDSQDVADKISLALAFEGRTNGRERIVSLGLTNDKVAQKLMEIYRQII